MPRCPPRAGRANGSAGVRWAASDRRNYFFLHPGTADRELAEVKEAVSKLGFEEDVSTGIGNGMKFSVCAGRNAQRRCQRTDDHC